MSIVDVSPAWRTAFATGLAYLLLLGIAFVVLFFVPYAVFAAR